MTRRRKILIAVLGVGVVGVAAYAVLVYWVSTAIVSAHQRSTSQELAGWEREYSQISTENDAERATEMLDYIRRYYVVGEGYRSDKVTEELLEAQRRRTIDSIVVALEEFKKRRASEVPTQKELSRERNAKDSTAY